MKKWLKNSNGVAIWAEGHSPPGTKRAPFSGSRAPHKEWLAPHREWRAPIRVSLFQIKGMRSLLRGVHAFTTSVRLFGRGVHLFDQPECSSMHFSPIFYAFFYFFYFIDSCLFLLCRLFIPSCLEATPWRSLNGGLGLIL